MTLRKNLQKKVCMKCKGEAKGEGLLCQSCRDRMLIEAHMHATTYLTKRETNSPRTIFYDASKRKPEIVA